LIQTPRELGIKLGQTLRLIEEKRIALIIPWTWEPETDSTVLLNSWAFWRSLLYEGVKSGPRCIDCKLWWDCYAMEKMPAYSSGICYPTDGRPAYVSDLFNAAFLEPKPYLEVSAVLPISVILQHRYIRGTATATEMRFKKSMTVSPFEAFITFKSRIDHLISTWIEKNPLTKGQEWYVMNPDWKAYESAAELDHTSYMPIHAVGITEGYVIETTERRQTWPDHLVGANPRVILGSWEIALACGLNILQKIFKDPIPEYWNWEATQLVNVQILNSVAFESVTGMAAPESPIFFEDYAKARIPSLSYYGSAEESEVVRGKFPPVESVGHIDAKKKICSEALIIFGIHEWLNASVKSRPNLCQCAISRGTLKL
jgi:hypothetical protein